MIKTVERWSDYLQFECEDCGTSMDSVTRLYHDAPVQNERQEFDVRNWTIAAVDVQCPSCHTERKFKFSIGPR